MLAIWFHFVYLIKEDAEFPPPQKQQEKEEVPTQECTFSLKTIVKLIYWYKEDYVVIIFNMIKNLRKKCYRVNFFARIQLLNDVICFLTIE